MSDFEQLISTIGNAVRNTACKVGNQVSIAGEEQKVRRAYEMLGRLHYQALRCGGSLTGEKFDRAAEQIRQGLERIREMKQYGSVDAGVRDEDFEDLG